MLIREGHSCLEINLKKSIRVAVLFLVINSKYMLLLVIQRYIKRIGPSRPKRTSHIPKTHNISIDKLDLQHIIRAPRSAVEMEGAIQALRNLPAGMNRF